MGVIDDYYGGYDTIALFTNSDGETDFQAAYDSQLPCSDSEDDQETDPFMRAFNYKFNMVTKEMGIDTSRNVMSKEEAEHSLWIDTGEKTSTGRPIYEGFCSSCHKICTVPFAPKANSDLPKCKRCFGSASTTGQQPTNSSSRRSSRRRSKKAASAARSSENDAKQPKEDAVPNPRRTLNPNAKVFTPAQ